MSNLYSSDNNVGGVHLYSYGNINDDVESIVNNKLTSYYTKTQTDALYFRNTAIQDLNMNGFKITHLHEAIDVSDAVILGQLLERDVSINDLYFSQAIQDISINAFSNQWSISGDLLYTDNYNKVSIGHTKNIYNLDVRDLSDNDTRVMINDCSVCDTVTNASLNIFIRENDTKEHIHLRRVFTNPSGTKIKDFGISLDEENSLTMGKYDQSGVYEELLYINENHTIEVEGSEGGDFVIRGTPNITLSGVHSKNIQQDISINSIILKNTAQDISINSIINLNTIQDASINSLQTTKQDNITGGATTILTSDLTANRALISNGSGKVEVSSISTTQLEHLSGIASNIQTQINNKQNFPPSVANRINVAQNYSGTTNTQRWEYFRSGGGSIAGRTGIILGRYGSSKFFVDNPDESLRFTYSTAEDTDLNSNPTAQYTMITPQGSYHNDIAFGVSFVTTERFRILDFNMNCQTATTHDIAIYAYSSTTFVNPTPVGSATLTSVGGNQSFNITAVAGLNGLYEAGRYLLVKLNQTPVMREINQTYPQVINKYLTIETGTQLNTSTNQVSSFNGYYYFFGLRIEIQFRADSIPFSTIPMILYNNGSLRLGETSIGSYGFKTKDNAISYLGIRAEVAYNSGVAGDRLMIGTGGNKMGIRQSGHSMELTTTNNGAINLLPNGTGNVGINTTSPAAKLQVIGNVRAGGQSYLNFNTRPSFVSSLIGHSYDYSGNNTLTHYSATSNSYYRPCAIMMGYFDSFQAGTDEDQRTGIGFLTGDIGDTDVRVQDRLKMYINNAGSVGIGVSNPRERLDINGNLRFTPSSRTTGATILYQDTATTTAYSSINMLAGGTNDYDGIITFNTKLGGFFNSAIGERMRIHTNGNVGININTPSEKLDVNGNAIIRGNATVSENNKFRAEWGTGINLSRFEIYDSSTLNMGWGRNFDDLFIYTKTESVSTGDIIFRPNEIERFRIKRSGRVGIATTNPLAGGLDININSTSIPSLLLRSGHSATTFNDGSQIAFSQSNAQYSHFIHTRHNTTAQNNAIDFYVANGTVASNTLTSGSTHTMTLNRGRVGVGGITDPAEVLDVSGNAIIRGDIISPSISGVVSYPFNTSATNAAYRLYKYLTFASYSSSTDYAIFTVQTKIPVPSPRMAKITIKGYGFSNSNSFEVDVFFYGYYAPYDYATGAWSVWKQNPANGRLVVYVSRHTSGFYSIVIGSFNSHTASTYTDNITITDDPQTFQYSRIVVDEYEQMYSSSNITDYQDWSISSYTRADWADVSNNWNRHVLAEHQQNLSVQSTVNNQGLDLYWVNNKSTTSGASINFITNDLTTQPNRFGVGTARIKVVSTNTTSFDDGVDMLFINKENDITEAERMRIKSNGNIGIGTSNPTDKLHIQDGSLKIFSGDNANQLKLTRNGTYTIGIGPEATPNLLLQGGNIGVGTTSPTRILHFTSSSSPYIRFHNTSTNNNFLIGQQGDRFSIWTNTNTTADSGWSERISVLNTNGNIGLAKTNPRGTVSIMDTYYFEAVYASGGGSTTIPVISIPNETRRYNAEVSYYWENSSGTRYHGWLFVSIQKFVGSIHNLLQNASYNGLQNGVTSTEVLSATGTGSWGLNFSTRNFIYVSARIRAD